MTLQEFNEKFNIKPIAKLPNEVKQPDAKVIDEYCKLVEKFVAKGEMKPAEMFGLMISDEGKRYQELSKKVQPFFQFRNHLIDQMRNN